MKQTTLKVSVKNQIEVNKIGYFLSLESGEKSTQDNVITFLLKRHNDLDKLKVEELLK